MNERNTFLGGIFTATNRSLTEATSELREAAYSGGIDFRHQWKNRTYYFQTNFVISHVKGTPESILATQQSLTHLFDRVDATHVQLDPTRTSLTGTGGLVEFGKDGGQNWNYDMGFKWSSPELELNDIGFLKRSDQKFQFFNLKYRTAKPVSIFRNINFDFSQFNAYDFGGNHNRAQYQLRTRLRFLNNSAISSWLTYRPRIYDNTALRGGPRWRFSEENFKSLFFRSDDRKKFNTKIGVMHSQSKDNNVSFLKFEVDFNYQILDALNVSLATEYSKRPNKTQYITQKDFSTTKRYILGTIDNQTFRSTFRINYTINPNLSLQYYAQPFISRGRYSDFKYVTDATANRLSDRFQLYDNTQVQYEEGTYYFDDNLDGLDDYSMSNPDFSVVQFNSNLVLRWEYIPGSELFLVWSQGIRTDVSLENGLIEGAQNGILEHQPQNIFLIKATYRFNL